MKIFIRTRGKIADYAFIGEAPSVQWWREFQDATSVEKPTLIVEGDGQQWRCFLSAIPSSRVDRVGTSARYSIAVQGACGEDIRPIISLVDAWLKDMTLGTVGRTVQSAVDSIFEEDTVERLLSLRESTPDSVAEVEKLSLLALSKFTSAIEPVDKSTEGSWVGSTDSSDAKHKFLSRCNDVLSGKFEGCTAVVNLLGNEKEATDFVSEFNLRKPRSSIMLLIDDIGCPLKRIEKKNPIHDHAIPAHTKAMGSLLIPAVLIVAAILMAIWALTPGTPPPP